MCKTEKQEVVDKLKDFVCRECLKKPEFELESDEALLTSGLLRSIHLVELAVFVEKELGVYIPDTEFNTANIDTLDSMAELVIKYRE
jgi:acyl carrier protein